MATTKRRTVVQPKLNVGSDGAPFIDYGDVPTAKHELGIAFRMYRPPRGKPENREDEGRRKHGFCFDRAWRLLVLVRAGNGLEQAAHAVGITTAGAMYWQKRGADPEEPEGSPYRVFQMIFDVFSACVEVDLVTKIHRAANSPLGIDHAKWLLTHRQGMKDRWAGKSETDVTSGGKPITGRKLQEIKVVVVDKSSATQEPEPAAASDFSEEKAEADAVAGKTIFDG